MTRHKKPFAMAATALALVLAACGSAQSQAPTEPEQSAPQETVGVSLEADAPYLTMINVLTPTKGTQEEVAASLQDGLENYVSKMPGFITASVHQSLDNDYVVVYAQWDDQASVDGAVKNIQGGEAPPMLEAFTKASPEFHPYRVRSVHLAK